MEKLTRQDLYDILYGCTILGTGGGGKLEEGLMLVDRAINDGKEFVLADLSEIPDDALIACPYYCGSISPLTPEQEAKYAVLPHIDEEPALRAFKILQEYRGQKFYGTISTELGGSNTAVAFYVAAMLGIHVIDADPAGRSVPELQHSTFFINKLSITPMVVANEFGDTVIVKDVVDDFRAEALVRAMAVVSKNHVGVADHPTVAGKLKEAVIPGAISNALKIGRAYRQAKEADKDLASELAKAGNGYIVFRGVVKDLTWQDKDGFTIGDTFIEGDREFTGSDYRIWFKNENIISWRNGKIDVTAPDLICIIADDTKLPVTNPNFEPGLRVSVIGLPAPKEWRTPEGLKVFGPKHFGYDIEYVPIEKMF